MPTESQYCSRFCLQTWLASESTLDYTVWYLDWFLEYSIVPKVVTMVETMNEMTLRPHDADQNQILKYIVRLSEREKEMKPIRSIHTYPSPTTIEQNEIDRGSHDDGTVA